MRFLYLLLVVATMQINAKLENLTLTQALNILENSNLEVKASKYEESMKYYDNMGVKAKSYGSLELNVMALRSNEAGNVFGFKIQSREATFGDLGFSTFLDGVTQVMQASNGDFDVFTQYMSNPQTQDAMLASEPEDLNYPDARSHFVTKLTYQMPIYVGGMLSSYRDITNKLYEMSKIDTDKVLSIKKFELKKTFYDISLVNSFISNLYRIKNNISKLKGVVGESKGKVML